jgi:hypothetical protein
VHWLLIFLPVATYGHNPIIILKFRIPSMSKTKIPPSQYIHASQEGEPTALSLCYVVTCTVKVELRKVFVSFPNIN